MTDRYDYVVIAGGDQTESGMTVAALKDRIGVDPDARAGWWSDWCFVELDDDDRIAAVPDGAPIGFEEATAEEAVHLLHTHARDQNPPDSYGGTEHVGT